MKQPTLKADVTQEQLDEALNLTSFPGATLDVPASQWHEGQWEAWCKDFGYSPTALAIYGGVSVNGEKVHLYYLPDRGATILLRRLQTPRDYGVEPRPTDR